MTRSLPPPPPPRRTAGSAVSVFSSSAFCFRPEDEPHLINLVRLPDEAGTVCFRLRHNSHGDYYGAPGVEPPLSVGVS